MPFPPSYCLVPAKEWWLISIKGADVNVDICNDQGYQNHEPLADMT